MTLADLIRESAPTREPSVADEIAVGALLDRLSDTERAALARVVLSSAQEAHEKMALDAMGSHRDAAWDVVFPLLRETLDMLAHVQQRLGDPLLPGDRADIVKQIDTARAKLSPGRVKAALDFRIL